MRKYQNLQQIKTTSSVLIYLLYIIEKLYNIIILRRNIEKIFFIKTNKLNECSEMAILNHLS